MFLSVADGKATGSIYFNLSSEVLTRTSSQTCGRWYLPTFLLRDGSLTLMYRASFYLFWSSALPALTSASKENFMSRWRVLVWGLPLSPIVANLHMERFEVEALRSAPHPPYLWKRFVDDTFTILQSSQRDGFLEYLNSIDQHIQFTAEDQREDGAMPFLDILVTPGRDGSLSTSVYRKPTHTDLYLQCDSHHTLTAKYSVIGTLQDRVNTLCSNTQLLHKEEQHLKNALKNCKYLTWALNRIQKKINNPGRKQVPTNRTSNNTQKKSYIVVPYYSGLSESIKNIGRKFGVQVYCKGGTTIKNLLMAPKDRDPIQKQSGVIYRYHCDRVDCDEEYIGESSRTFGERFKEHLKPHSPIYDHWT